jgi:hypothetical protein
MVFGKTRGNMACPAFGSIRNVAGYDMAGIAALREAKIQMPLMER